MITERQTSTWAHRFTTEGFESSNYHMETPCSCATAPRRDRQAAILLDNPIGAGHEQVYPRVEHEDAPTRLPLL